MKNFISRRGWGYVVNLERSGELSKQLWITDPLNNTQKGYPQLRHIPSPVLKVR